MQRETEILELVSAIVLDAEIAQTAAEDALAIAIASNADRLQMLSIARAEAWRQQRARNVFPYDERLLQAGADPVTALTLIERTALGLVGRLALSDFEAAIVLGVKPKQFRKMFLKSKMALVRAATAVTLISMDSRCPAVVSGKHRFGTALDRRTAMHFVVHAGECSICVPILREIDRNIFSDYEAAPPIEAKLFPSAGADALLRRAKLVNGYAKALPEDFRDQSRTIQRAVWIAGISSVLLGIAWLLSRYSA